MSSPPKKNPASLPTKPVPAPAVNPAPRRNFLMEGAAVLIGFVTVAVPATAGAIFALNPLIRKPRPVEGVASDGFRKVGRVKDLTKGGLPVLFPIIGGKKDAWTTYPETSLGAVYVRQDAEGKLSALNASCTHLGCMVKLREGEAAEFKCPCHASSFSLDGVRSNDIPPRNMDQLAVEVRNNDEIWVKFQKYRAGREDQVPV